MNSFPTTDHLVLMNAEKFMTLTPVDYLFRSQANHTLLVGAHDNFLREHAQELGAEVSRSKRGKGVKTADGGEI
jgi:flavin-dependent dehydrogenase